MDVLILGGTTFFGKEIARVFHEAGHAVTLFTRGVRDPGDLPPVARLKGNRQVAEDLGRAGSKWDLVIDNLAFTGEDLRIALRAFQGVGRYFLTSTVSVYKYARSGTSQPLREEAVRFDEAPAGEKLDEKLGDPHWSYARGKWEAEKLLRESSVPWTIFRPTVVYGPHDPKDRTFWYLGRMLKGGGPLLLPNGGVNGFRLVFSKDVARAYLQAAQSGRSLGRTYNLAQAEVITLRDLLDESARALGIEPSYLSVPRELLGEMGGPHADLVNFIPDSSAATSEIDFHPTPWRKFTAESALWFREHWQGDEGELYKTRPLEIRFAMKWQSMISKLFG